jgi:hypothetical protein
VHSRDSTADELTVETTGAGAPFEPGQIVSANGITYEVSPDAGCNATSSVAAPQAPSAFDLAASLIAVVGADSAGPDAVGTTPAARYTFDERALGLAGVATASGTLWDATDPAYLARYELSTQGNEGYFGAGTSGTMTWSYEVANVGEATNIAVPAGCAGVLSNAPTMTDATNIDNQPGLLRYDSASKMADVIAFYGAQAGQLGWATIQPAVNSDDAAFIEYSDGTSTMTIFMRTEPTGTQVTILSEPVAVGG